MHIEPITCLRPQPDRVAEFASLPYDVFTEGEARAYVAAHPTSFLAIDRPETAFPEGYDPHAPEVYQKARELLRERQLDRTLVPDEHPCYYLYELTQGTHRQLGLMAAVAVDDYLDGTIRRHELTLPAKEQDRVEHIRTVRAQTGPVFLAYEDSPAIDIILGAAHAAEPLYDFVSADGVRQRVWRIARPVAVDAIGVAFTTVARAYLADGHHRAAAAVRICEERRAEGRQDDPAEAFLAVLFPKSQLQILPYDRVVRDTAGVSAQELVGRVRQAGYSCEGPLDEALRPDAKGTFGMFAGNAWYELRWQGEARGENQGDTAPALDAELLQRTVLYPILGIDDPRTSERIEFVGGLDADELASRTPQGGVAFSLRPTSMDELIATSDAGGVMPPKSTWFSPKLLSGLALRRIW